MLQLCGGQCLVKLADWFEDHRKATVSQIAAKLC